MENTVVHGILVNSKSDHHQHTEENKPGHHCDRRSDLLFPSYLQHSVDANGGSEPRISVSFNLMFDDFAENMSKPLWVPPPSDPGNASDRKP